MDKSAHCEVKRNRAEETAWKSISIGDAMELYRRDLKRCPACHGMVVLRAAGGKTPAHFEHRVKHDGCPLSHQFDGHPRLHPHPLG